MIDHTTFTQRALGTSVSIAGADCSIKMASRDDLLHAFTVVQETINRLESLTNPRERERLATRLEYLNRALINLNNDSELDEVVSLIERAVRELTHENDVELRHDVDDAPKVWSGRRGRPSFDIREDQLSFLVEQGFQVSVIAKLLRVSSRTVERRMAKFGLSVSATYSSITDDELDDIVRTAQTRHPGIGLRMLMGHVHSRGHRMQWERLRQSLLRTDPMGVYQRGGHPLDAGSIVFLDH